jgi:hypothetical protein
MLVRGHIFRGRGMQGVLFDQERMLGARRRLDTVVVLAVNKANWIVVLLYAASVWGRVGNRGARRTPDHGPLAPSTRTRSVPATGSPGYLPRPSSRAVTRHADDLDGSLASLPATRREVWTRVLPKRLEPFGFSFRSCCATVRLMGSPSPCWRGVRVQSDSDPRLPSFSTAETQCTATLQSTRNTA